jgi:hypothetical protein
MKQSGPSATARIPAQDEPTPALPSARPVSPLGPNQESSNSPAWQVGAVSTRRRKGLRPPAESRLTDLTPEVWMGREELKSAKAMLRRLESAKRRLCAERGDSARDLQLVGTVSERLSELAAAVLQRELSVEEFMVIHVEQENGYESKFLVREVSLAWGTSHKMEWLLKGSALRKDESSGNQRDGARFTSARIGRRLLQDRWVGLLPRIQRGERHASVGR